MECGVRVMSGRMDELAEALSASEREALEALARKPGRSRVEAGTAVRLLGLGLAELSLGELDLTAAGRRVLRAMHHGREALGQ